MTFVTFFVSLLLFFLSFLKARSSAPPDCKQYNDTLKNIDPLRKILVGLEDIIVFNMIERSKYLRNPPLYDTNAGLLKCPNTSLFEFFIKQSEAVQAKAGRYNSSEVENAFYPNILPASLVMLPTACPPVLHRGTRQINVTGKILDMYKKWLLPNITVEGDDRNYASAAAADLNCLQALSTRIHYGKFVAEAKFLNKSETKNYTAAIQKQDRKALRKMLTYKAVEQAVKNRVKDKASLFTQDVDQGLNDTNAYKVDPRTVYDLYDKYVIGLTKDVEVEYLLRRLK